jgi:hypothetical protein
MFCLSPNVLIRISRFHKISTEYIAVRRKTDTAYGMYARICPEDVLLQVRVPPVCIRVCHGGAAACVNGMTWGRSQIRRQLFCFAFSFSFSKKKECPTGSDVDVHVMGQDDMTNYSGHWLCAGIMQPRGPWVARDAHGRTATPRWHTHDHEAMTHPRPLGSGNKLRADHQYAMGFVLLLVWTVCM